jgi:pseudouridine-5'-phosphate glycosidase
LNDEVKMTFSPPSWLQLSPSVYTALQANQPVLALESSAITHGLPKPVNLELSTKLLHLTHSTGAEPAIAAVLRGQIRLGLLPEELEELALAVDVHKISRRDFAVARANRRTGGTTVSATMVIAHAAGIRAFATGGIGGVHRGDSGDISSDLMELALTPMVVICSGAKSILDLPRTLEYLETVSVPVLGWQTDEFPAFFSRSSGLAVNARVDSVTDVARILHAHWEMGLKGVLVCVPCPEEVALPADVVEKALIQAESEARAQTIHGNDLTPFLLSRLAEITDGATLRANLALLRNNALIGAQIAKAII